MIRIGAVYTPPRQSTQPQRFSACGVELFVVKIIK
jgi:hypothetical protein